MPKQDSGNKVFSVFARNHEDIWTYAVENTHYSCCAMRGNNCPQDVNIVELDPVEQFEFGLADWGVNVRVCRAGETSL